MGRLAFIALLFCLALAPVHAEFSNFTFIAPRFNFRILGGPPVPTGADVELRFPLGDPGGAPLALSLRLGAGYEDGKLVRDPASGEPIPAPATFDDPARFDAPNAQWDLGVVLGLIRGSGGNLLEAFLLYRGRWDVYRNDFSTAVFPDSRGMFGTALLAGLGYDRVRDLGRGLKSGAAAEVSAEWGPGFLASRFGPVEYGRFNASIRGYLPLLPENSSLYRILAPQLALRAAADAAFGPDQPLFVLQNFGGRYEGLALAGEVRGYPTRAYDASLKAFGNLELRVFGPALGPAAPVVLGFLDAGRYSGLHKSPSYGDSSGTLASLGAGLALGIGPAFHGGIYAGTILPVEDPLFEVYVPGGGRGFLSAMFTLHF